MVLSRSDRDRAIQGVHKRLSLLFNVQPQQEYNTKMETEFSTALCDFFTSDHFADRVRDCLRFSDLNSDDSALTDQVKKILRGTARQLLGAYFVRHDASDIGALRYAWSVEDQHNPFNMFEMGNRGKDICEAYINHIVGEALVALHDDVGMTKRSALSITGQMIGATVGMTRNHSSDVSMYAIVEPQRAACGSDVAAEHEWNIILNYWVEKKDAITSEYRMRRSYAAPA